ncbi:hypothetical protein J3459_016344 [Metarhizium acridum]|nr:hypothetical protein J3459_016344 [Metarhizium acridum]
MDVELEGTPVYHDRKDGFSLRIQLRSLLPEKLTLDSAKLRITCTDEDREETQLGSRRENCYLSRQEFNLRSVQFRYFPEAIVVAG